MGHFNRIKLLLVFCLNAAFLASAAFAEEQLPHPDTYLPLAQDVHEIIKLMDDPKDLMVTHPPKKMLPPEVWEYLKTDVEKSKRMTAELVGFKSPDVVGNIAPEIKPGKYTYQDLEKYPGLKELIPPELVQQIRAGGPPIICAIPEFEIIPTRQLYWHDNLCEMTKQNLGKTKLDKDGYIDTMSWEGGFPFPKPSGQFKAQEVFYTYNKRSTTMDFCYALRGESAAFNKNLKRDNYNQYDANFIKLKGRCLFPPFGWFDKRAKKNDEYRAFSNMLYAPRGRKGTVYVDFYYDDPYKMDPWMVYVPSLRRIRKMLATDTQDPMGDSAYDDRGMIRQKITPLRYPYKFKIIEERDYLMPLSWNNTTPWVDSKNGYALRGAQFMRRPCYVLQMDQQDPNYIYSKRVLYIDKENFNCTFSANYDQKGRHYRSQIGMYVFMPETGQSYPYGTQTIQFDYVDLHSSYQMQIYLASNFSRDDFTIKHMIRKSK